jgi:hypothetical protein
MSVMFRNPVSRYETDDYGWIKQQNFHIYHSTLSRAAMGNGHTASGKYSRLKNTVLGM